MVKTDVCKCGLRVLELSMHLSALLEVYPSEGTTSEQDKRIRNDFSILKEHLSEVNKTCGADTLAEAYLSDMVIDGFADPHWRLKDIKVGVEAALREC